MELIGRIVVVLGYVLFAVWVYKWVYGWLDKNA